MQDIISHLQRQVIADLKAQLEQDKFVDFVALQDMCDSSQDQAILVLMQLQQRTITLGPVENLPLSHLSIVGRLSSSPQNVDQNLGRNCSSATLFTSLDTSSSSRNSNNVRNVSSSPPIRPMMPPSTPSASQYSLRPDSARESRERTSTDKRQLAQYKPMATTVTTTGLFGIGKRTKVEPAVNLPENPLVDEYLAVAIEDANNELYSSAAIKSRTNSMSTAVSSIYEPDHPASNSWQDYHASSPPLSRTPPDPVTTLDTVRYSPSHRFSGSVRSFDSQNRVSAAPGEGSSCNALIDSINPKDLLPSEMNNFAGFCKGAWRQQIGDRRRALEERVRPGGLYNIAKYYQCKQCKFEGRLIPVDKKKSGFDMRVFKLVPGIQFRWEFMFKSHIQVKQACSDPTKATFGCIFCCADGRGTPMFEGIQTFMNHLIKHREYLPTGEVLYRMNCLVGRQATIDEDFDINITSIEGGKA